MPPKKKAAEEEISGAEKIARFGRVKNNLKMGLVGLPNVGKSSLFNLLTDQAVPAEVRVTVTPSPTPLPVSHRPSLPPSLHPRPPPLERPAPLKAPRVKGSLRLIPGFDSLFAGLRTVPNRPWRFAFRSRSDFQMIPAVPRPTTFFQSFSYS